MSTVRNTYQTFLIDQAAEPARAFATALLSRFDMLRDLRDGVPVDGFPHLVERLRHNALLRTAINTALAPLTIDRLTFDERDVIADFVAEYHLQLPNVMQPRAVNVDKEAIERADRTLRGRLPELDLVVHRVLDNEDVMLWLLGADAQQVVSSHAAAQVIADPKNVDLRVALRSGIRSRWDEEDRGSAQQTMLAFASAFELVVADRRPFPNNFEL